MMHKNAKNVVYLFKISIIFLLKYFRQIGPSKIYSCKIKNFINTKCADSCKRKSLNHLISKAINAFTENYTEHATLLRAFL